MAIESIPDGFQSTKDRLKEYDDNFQEIILSIYFYLFQFENSWFLHLIGKQYLLKCYKSWALITETLDKFLINPQVHYSSMVTLIEQEMVKFPPQAHYRKQLQLLKNYLSKGPSLRREHSDHKNKA